MWNAPVPNGNAALPRPRPAGSAGSTAATNEYGWNQTNGTQVLLWDCNGNGNQTWTLTSGNQLTVFGTKCLEAAGQGSAVQIDTCTAATDQQWTFNPNGTVTNGASGLCLDVNGGGTDNNTPIIVWGCHGGSNQAWTRR